MSGGVDSTVTAAMLQAQGHEVAGVMMRLFDERCYGTAPASRTCCSLNDVEDARSAALKLGIPFHVLNMADRFKETVIDRFAAAYSMGQTPNPCLDCNRYLKFSALLERALGMGFDAIATGHYANIEQDATTGRWLLKQAADTGKDQSYVLYTLTQHELAHLSLPLGKLTKPEVRQTAESLQLINWNKPDSQDICFVPDGDYAAFLDRECNVKAVPGDFVNRQGEVLGRHKGIVHYTVGQRRGLGISAPERLFVVAIDSPNNRVVLGYEKDLQCLEFTVARCNWIAVETLQEPVKVKVRTRYHQIEREATLYPDNDTVRVVYNEPCRAPAPGQAAVFYIGDTVLGGGVIQGHTLL